MTPAQSKRAGIACKRAACDRLYRMLDLWAAVEAQGVDVDTVETLGFDRARVTLRQRMDIRRCAIHGGRDPISGVIERSGLLYAGERLPNGHYVPTVYNFVRHKDGRTTLLDPMLKAP
jgi:hypothetical protein